MSSATAVNEKVALFSPLEMTTRPALLPRSVTEAPSVLELALMVQVMVAVPKEPILLTFKLTAAIELSGSDTVTCRTCN